MDKRVPQNKVGDRQPTETEIAQMSSSSLLLLDTASLLGPPLGQEEAKQLTIARVGYEQMAEVVIRLAERAKLQADNASIENIRNDLKLIETLEPIYQDTAHAARLMRDILRQARSEAWDGVLSFYAVLKVMARTSPKLAIALRPVVEFMSLGARVSAVDAGETER
jgi:hypothetical protein